jgi:hypothetical protein
LAGAYVGAAKVDSETGAGAGVVDFGLLLLHFGPKLGPSMLLLPEMLHVLLQDVNQIVLRGVARRNMRPSIGAFSLIATAHRLPA